MPKQGLHLITPSAAVASGTGSSATINANGSVSFTAVTSLELRGVFSADYDNYQIVCRWTQSTTNGDLTCVVVSGSTPANGFNYTYQTLSANGTTIVGARFSSQTNAYVLPANTTRPFGFVLNIYGPYLSQATVGRSLAIDSLSNARIYDSAWSHNLSTSYDGTQFSVSGGTGAGLVAVYGMRK